MITFLFLGVGAVFLIWFAYSLDRRAQQDFELKFPPIDDEEFLRRCSPGTNPEVALKVREIFAKFLGVEYERIYPSSRIAEDLGAD